ncbi:MAG: hypothetical protein F6K24_52035 [Okeania sp. SIO2D1]|nr:hypothetical protein [Okeania sp. SIO2D1]
MGLCNYRDNLYRKDTIDWTTNPSDRIAISSVNSTADWDNYNSSLTGTMTQIENAKIKYGLPNGKGCSGGANSNSAAYQRIRELGITPPAPEVNAPCWEINPFEAQRYEAQVPDAETNTEVATLNTDEKPFNSPLIEGE